MSFTWLPRSLLPPPPMEQQSLSATLLLLVCCCQTAVPYPEVLLYLSAAPGLGKEQQGYVSVKWEGQSSPPQCQLTPMQSSPTITENTSLHGLLLQVLFSFQAEHVPSAAPASISPAALISWVLTVLSLGWSIPRQDGTQLS